jgi:putative MATE family efflux protein
MDEKIESIGLFSSRGRASWREMGLLSWPVAAEQLLIIGVNMLITMLIGTISGRSLAAIGMVNMILTVVQAALAMLSTGAMVLAARMVGEGRTTEVARVAQQALWAVLVLALAVTAGGMLLAGPIVEWLMKGSEPALKADTRLYLQVAMLSVPGLMINLVLSGVLRGSGNTKTPMAISMLMNGSQLVLSFILVVAVKGGIAAAAWAAVLARGLGAVLSYLPFHGRKSAYPLALRALRPDWPMLKRLFQVGFPASVESTVIQAGYLMQNALIVGMGTQPATVYQVTSSINTFPNIFSSVLMTVIITLVGQRLGGGKLSEAKLACRQALILGGVMAALSSAVMAALGIPLAQCYSEDATVQETTRRMLWILVLANGPALIINVMAGTLKAAGDTKYVMIVSVIGVWAVRAPLIGLFCYWMPMGIEGTYWAILADYMTRAGLYLLRYLGNRWLYIKI